MNSLKITVPLLARLSHLPRDEHNLMSRFTKYSKVRNRLHSENSMILFLTHILDTEI